MWLSKDKFNQTPWHMAAESGHIEVLEEVWYWAKELQVNPEELKNQVWLLTDNSEQTAWHMAPGGGQDEVSEKLWDWAKELQLKPEEFRNELLSKGEFNQMAWHMAAGKCHIEIL